MIIDPKDILFQETHKLMIGSIVPRPIALVSTISKEDKVNLAPFSYFNGVCSKPPTIVFCPARRGWDGTEKDTYKLFDRFLVLDSKKKGFFRMSMFSLGGL